MKRIRRKRRLITAFHIALSLSRIWVEIGAATAARCYRLEGRIARNAQVATQSSVTLGVFATNNIYFRMWPCLPHRLYPPCPRLLRNVNGSREPNPQRDQDDEAPANIFHNGQPNSPADVCSTNSASTNILFPRGSGVPNPRAQSPGPKLRTTTSRTVVSCSW